MTTLFGIILLVSRHTDPEYGRKRCKKDLNRIILGIDPGTTLMGYGVIKGSGKTPDFVALDVVDLRRVGDPLHETPEDL